MPLLQCIILINLGVQLEILHSRGREKEEVTSPAMEQMEAKA